MSSENKLGRNIYHLLKPYAEKRIDVRDIRVMLYIDRGIALSTERITSVLTKSRARGKLPPLSQEERGRANSGRILFKRETEPIEFESKSASIKNVVLPYYLRGGSQFEIAEITGYKRLQVVSAVYEIKKSSQPVQQEPYSDPEGRSALLNVARGRGRSKKEPDSDLLAEVDFAKKLHQSGKLDSTLRVWNEYVEMFKDKGLKIPPSLAAKIRQEFFFQARRLVRNGDESLFNEYLRLGREVDRAWFTGEEMNLERRMISEAVNPPVQNPSHYRQNYNQGYGRRNSAKA